MKAITDVADDVLEADPHSISNVAAALYRKSPKARDRFDKAKKDLEEVMLGLRPLTQDEIDKLDSKGVDLKEFEANRQKNFQKKFKRVYLMALEGLVVRPAAKQAFTEAAKHKEAEVEEEDEIAALASAKRKRRTARKKGKSRKQKGKASERPLAVSKYFDD